MARGQAAAGLLLLALILNVGWLAPPLGALALVVASIGLHRAVNHRWSMGLQVAVLAAVWTAYLYLLTASGVTIGLGDRQLASFGGGERMDGLRIAMGAAVPLMAAVALAVQHEGWCRDLAVACLGTWLVLVPAAIVAGYLVHADPGILVKALITLPFLLGYALALAAAAWAWRGWRDPRPGARPDGPA